MPKLRFTAVNGATLKPPAFPTDVGADLTAISLVKQIGNNTWMFDTGIRVYPEAGFYVEVVARSSMVKTGYVLSNSVGIIDPTFTGTIKIVLTKVDDSLPDVQLPFTVCQVVLRPLHVIELEQIEAVPETERGADGFGSTG